MNKEKIITIGVVMFILLVAGGIIYMKNFQVTGGVIQNIVTVDEAKWIGEHSTLYIQTGCSHCKDQEDLFGENIKYLNMINYFDDNGKQKFIDAGIEGTPTWIINGQKYVGVQTIDELKNLTGYK